MSLAPIAFFAYKRPEHTLRSLTALSRCRLAQASRLYIFCDGPKPGQAGDQVAKVREVVASRPWCGEVQILARQENLGLAASVREGVTRLCREYGRVIVLEDDLVMSPGFLSYMNLALDRYRDEQQVMQVSGHMFDARLKTDADALFLSFVTSWGWGTWQRAWCGFQGELEGYQALRNDKALRQRFNLDGHYDYFGILERQAAGLVDSWAILWNLFVFNREGLVLYPVRSLIANQGFDGSGTHCHSAVSAGSGLVLGEEQVRLPVEITEFAGKEEVYRAISRMYSPPFLRRLYRKMTALLRGTR